MGEVADSPGPTWEAFVKWAKIKGISFERKAHWGPWWECWKAAVESCKELPKILTCVYCGIAYPEGTPPSKAQILTDHIRVCEKHPLRQAEDKIMDLSETIIERDDKIIELKAAIADLQIQLLNSQIGRGGLV